MFGWGKKNDGFEWHKYVRTTILVRREHRRRKLKDAKEAAVQGLKDAGEELKDAGKRGAVAGAQAAGQGARLAGDGLAQARQQAHAGGAWFAASAGRLFRTSVKNASNLTDQALSGGRRALNRAHRQTAALAAAHTFQRIWPAMVVIGCAAALGGAASVYLFGLGAEALTPLLISAIALLLAVTPYIRAPSRSGNTQIPKRKRPPKQKPAKNRQWFTGLSSAVTANARTTAGRVGGTALLIFLAGGIGAAAWLLPSPPNTSAGKFAAKQLSDRSPLRGRATVLSGDTLRINGERIHLAGIEAPEHGQRCNRSKRRTWRCDLEAKNTLRRLVGRKTVTCSASAPDSDGVQRADCTVDGKNIAAELVKSGYAFANQGFFARYRTLERAARNKKSGVWQGKAERPEQYRAKLWEEAKRKAPEGCPIKARTYRSGRVYFLPWSRRYDRVRIGKRSGARWFCSEEDAVAAGFRLSDNS